MDTISQKQITVDGDLVTEVAHSQSHRGSIVLHQHTISHTEDQSCYTSTQSVTQRINRAIPAQSHK